MAEDTTLRDRLAVSRTHLANERTFLAYARTALGLLIAGASFLHFASGIIMGFLGLVMIAASIVIFFFGRDRYERFHAGIRAQERKAGLGRKGAE